MKTSDKIRRIYDLRPYPFGNGRSSKRRSWSLLPEWVGAFGNNGIGAFEPRRILVAGCGDGTEAFNLARQFPKAEIVAFDFSARSVGVAKRVQRKFATNSKVRFLVADLIDPALPARVAGRFDLITCHGVLSYVSLPVRALKNFARCLAPDGILYLGANGSENASTRLRAVLPDLGFDLDVFQDGPRVRGMLAFCDNILASDDRPRVSSRSAVFLAGDVFGSLNRSETLATWVGLGRRAGLSFRGCLGTLGRFRTVAEDGSYAHLMPRSRAQVADIIERLAPSQFHRMLFSLAPEPAPPWTNREELLDWSIAPTFLYTFKIPTIRGKVKDRLRPFRISSAKLRLAMDWEMPEWELELLRGGQLRSLLAEMPLAVPFVELSRQLYLLYLLGVIKLIPPPVPAASRIRRT
jgi:SAM-dependent methyltransferase